MAKMNKFDRAVFFWVLTGTALGTAGAVALLLWAVPGAHDYRPAVLSSVVIPLACFVGWILSPSRERAPVAALVCFGVYFLSAFVAARLGTLVSGWSYFPTVVGVQGLAGLGLAVGLAFLGRALPQVERLRAAGDMAGLAALARQGTPAERLEAVRALGTLGGEAARPHLLAALDDAAVPVCREALNALAGLATAVDIPRLDGLLQHPDPQVRRGALRVLRWIEGDAARKAVANYRRHKSTSP